MFRQAPQLMARATTVAMRCRRQFSTDVPVEASADSTFVEAWRKLIPNIEPPKTPSSFMTPRPSTPASIPTKLTVNFVLPYSSQLSNKEAASKLPSTATFSSDFVILSLVLFLQLLLTASNRSFQLLLFY
ncbi:hypothetical protein CsSME_00028888 [Camellia sinensis var. sinensis]